MKNTTTIFFLKSLFIGLVLRFTYLFFKAGEITKINLGGDPCHHFNIAYNISKFNGPKTDFIFAFWHRHETLPALTDVYPPGFHFFSALFIFFYDDFLISRIISLTIFLLNIYLIIIIANKINRKDLGIFTSLLVLVNYFHVENSVVFMTVTFYMLLIQIFFYFLITFDIYKKSIFFIGMSVGYSSITFGGWQLLVVIISIYLFANKHKILKDYLLLFFGFFLIAVPWGIITYNYFGTPYYSNLNFYPIVKEWSSMMISTTKPSIQVFINNLEYVEYFKNHLFWFLKNLIKFSLTLFPTFLFPLSFLLIPMIIHGAIKLKKYGYYFLGFIFLYFATLSFSSYALNGNLHPRHFLPLLFCVSFLLSSSIIELYKSSFLSKYLIFFKRYENYSLGAIFLITLSGILYVDTPWNKNTKPFFIFGEKIKKIVPADSRIMYGSTPQDLWCVSDRQVVLDPNNMKNFKNQYRKNRVIEEIEQYKPDYVLLDFSNHIYDRSHNNLKDTLKNFTNYNLSLKLSDEINRYYLYKIN